MNEVLKQLKERKSTRVFTDREITADEKAKMVLVFGFPAEQQLARPKPKRADIKHIVHENGYRNIDERELREMFALRSGEKGFDDYMKEFCERKYNSDFSREMTASVKKYIEEFDYLLCHSQKAG